MYAHISVHARTHTRELVNKQTIPALDSAASKNPERSKEKALISLFWPHLAKCVSNPSSLSRPSLKLYFVVFFLTFNFPFLFFFFSNHGNEKQLKYISTKELCCI